MRYHFRTIFLYLNLVVPLFALYQEVGCYLILIQVSIINKETTLQVFEGMLQILISCAIINRLSICSVLDFIDEDVSHLLHLLVVIFRRVYLVLYHNELFVKKFDLLADLVRPQRVVNRGVFEEVYLKLV